VGHDSERRDSEVAKTGPQRFWSAAVLFRLKRSRWLVAEPMLYRPQGQLTPSDSMHALRWPAFRSFDLAMESPRNDDAERSP
jgi:hypothetical protein